MSRDPLDAYCGLTFIQACSNGRYVRIKSLERETEGLTVRDYEWSGGCNAVVINPVECQQEGCTLFLEGASEGCSFGL